MILDCKSVIGNKEDTIVSKNQLMKYQIENLVAIKKVFKEIEVEK